MTKGLSVLLWVLLLGGCATSTVQPTSDYEARKADIHRHSFERRLYTINRKVPLLTLKEWEEIKAQFLVTPEYVFDSAVREKEDLVSADFVGKGTPPVTRLTLYFEKKDGRWVENKERREELVRLNPIY